MPKYVYRFSGDFAEHFPFLPADPPSLWLEPGDTVTCSEPVEHPRLQLQKDKAKQPPAADTTKSKEA